MSDSPTPEAGSTPSPAPAAPAEPVAPPAAVTAVATAEPPAPVAETPVETPAAETPAAETSAPGPTAAPAPGAPKAKRSVQVPVWLLVGVLGVALVLGAFFVGRSTAPDSDSGPATLAEAVEMTASGEMEVGEFDAGNLIDALRQNDELDLGIIGDLLLDGLQGNGRR